MIDAFDIAESAVGLSLMVESLYAAGVPTDCGATDSGDTPDTDWPDA
ncbi:hypothetical protein QLQ15_13650 [Lysobacter sp. LF1]|uniref:Uncharacterized protein n=1 Tax=Lysobacter stagni TaxID=3045172 RepID=A0ABT6XIG9_9GAMM|nr:hypothetical protein [Lysobacter sp. LF1]MDI9239952.1 hypothetical protein [Lysobacter sp. LF1]